MLPALAAQSFTYRPGVIPNAALNVRVKWAWSAKPASSAVSALAVKERASFALVLGRLSVVPHVVVHDELPPAFEYVKQPDTAAFADHRDRAIDLDHREPAPGCRDPVAFARMRLLADYQFVDPCLPARPIRHWRQRRACRCLRRPDLIVRPVDHCCLPALRRRGFPALATLARASAVTTKQRATSGQLRFRCSAERAVSTCVAAHQVS